MGLIWGLAFMVPEGGMQALKEGKHTIDVPGYYNYELLTEIYFHWILILHYHWDKHRLWQGDRRVMQSGFFNLLSIRSPLRLDQFKTDGIWDDHTEAKTECLLLLKNKQTNSQKTCFIKYPWKYPQNQLKCQSVSRVRTFIMHLFPVRLSKRNAKKPLELLLVDFRNHLSWRI